MASTENDMIGVARSVTGSPEQCTRSVTDRKLYRYGVERVLASQDDLLSLCIVISDSKVWRYFVTQLCDFLKLHPFEITKFC